MIPTALNIAKSAMLLGKLHGFTGYFLFFSAFAGKIKSFAFVFLVVFLLIVLGCVLVTDWRSCFLSMFHQSLPRKGVTRIGIINMTFHVPSCHVL